MDSYTWLDVLKAINFEAGIVLILLLNFSDFEPRCSYKIVLMKKRVYAYGSITYWTKKQHGRDSFTRAQIKLLTYHLIKETYFKIGNLLFKQCIGIPKGIDPAPFWANLHLYSYEQSFLSPN